MRQSYIDPHAWVALDPARDTDAVGPCRGTRRQMTGATAPSSSEGRSRLDFLDGRSATPDANAIKFEAHGRSRLGVARCLWRLGRANSRSKKPARERIRKRYPDAAGEDYLFLPGYPNRATASRIFQRQFCFRRSSRVSSTTPSPRRSAASTACVTPRSACASFSPTAR